VSVLLTVFAGIAGWILILGGALIPLAFPSVPKRKWLCLYGGVLTVLLGACYLTPLTRAFVIEPLLVVVMLPFVAVASR